MLLPLFLRLEGKDALVVGAGQVAENKIADLVDAGALVRVVSLGVPSSRSVKELADRGLIELTLRAFQPTDVEGAWLVVAATSDKATQKSICDSADAHRIFSIAIDDPPNGSAYSASVIRREPGGITIAISSSGEAPALSRLLREVLEQALPDADWVEAAKELRTKWKAEGTPMSSRFADLVRAFKEKAAT